MLGIEQFFENIQKHLDSKLPLVVYKKPKENQLNAILQSTEEIHFTEDFSEQGFVFAPFDNKEKSIILLPDVFLTTILDGLNIYDTKNNITDAYSKIENEAYVSLIEKAIHSIHQKTFEKVVLSRVETIIFTMQDNLKAFKKMCLTYPSAFVYIWYHPKIGLWMGATPETLLVLEENMFSTMSLAGTQLYRKEGNTQWNEKEKREQQIVTNTIVSNLEQVEGLIKIKTSEVETVKAGNLLHLKTVVKGFFNSINLKEIIYALHPTPAVCGFPTASAKKFILEYENYHRSFYTGFLGELNMTPYPNKTAFSHLFVNLRCMEIKNNEALLYVGGGITKESSPESEWEETVNKSQTMKKVLFES